MNIKNCKTTLLWI